MTLSGRLQQRPFVQRRWEMFDSTGTLLRGVLVVQLGAWRCCLHTALN
jgi:hypothetical protein